MVTVPDNSYAMIDLQLFNKALTYLNYPGKPLLSKVLLFVVLKGFVQ
jgi:hypothetical protein